MGCSLVSDRVPYSFLDWSKTRSVQYKVEMSGCHPDAHVTEDELKCVCGHSLARATEETEEDRREQNRRRPYQVLGLKKAIR